MSVNKALVKSLMACCVTQITANINHTTLFHHTIANTDIPLKELKILQKRGANFNAVEGSGLSILSVAIICDRSNDCMKNLVKFGANPNAADLEGDTPLHVAVEKGNLELATFLVSEGVDVNAANKRGDAPLHRVFTLKTGSAEFAKLLLANGAKINAIGSIGYTPAKIMVHYEYADFELMQVFKEYGADFNCTEEDIEGYSLLYSAVSLNVSMDFIRNLVLVGADHKVTNSRGETPLFMAVIKGYVEAAEFLISIGCEVNATDNEGQTPLHFVFLTSEKTAPTAKLLLLKGANVNAKDYGGSTPLQLIGLHEEGGPSDILEVLEILKEHGADFNCVDKDGISPLSFCIFEGKSSTLLQKLVDLGANWKFVQKKLNNMTLFHMASIKLDLDAANWLLSLGADINERDKEGQNALEYTFERLEEGKSYEMIKFLLERGIKLNSTDNDGLTSLHRLPQTSADLEKVDMNKVFGLLEKHGADFNALDNMQRSPLEIAVDMKMSIKFITSLLDHGADPKIPFTKDGTLCFTSLHLAAVLNNSELVTLLISRGCDVNALEFPFLHTPLHSMILGSKRNDNVFEMTKVFLANGADPKIKNWMGRTVMDDAMEMLDDMDQRVVEAIFIKYFSDLV